MPSTTPKLINEIVKAGAGAGKTRRLSKKVIEVAKLFHEKCDRSPRIIVSTYTRKATEELRERITQEVFNEFTPELVDFVSSRYFLHISTIHGVLSKLLRLYGHLIGIEPSFKVLDAPMTPTSHRKILKSLFEGTYNHLAIWESYSFEDIL